MTRFKLITFLLMAFMACGPKSASRGAPEPAVKAENLPGNYSMKMVVDGDTHYSPAIVKEAPDGSFQIARITVYGPVTYTFTLGENSSVVSRELGTGTVTYQKELSKTTIHFEKEGALCELSK